MKKQKNKGYKLLLKKVHTMVKSKQFRQESRVAQITGGIFCLAGGLLLGIFFLIKTHEEFAANFADDTLRPLIGNQFTIDIESLFFGVEDHANLLSYSLFHVSPLSSQPSSNVKLFSLPSLLTSPATLAASHPFTLSPITPLLKTPYPDEGRWITLVTQGTTPLIAKAYYRPDPTRPYVVTDIVKMNMQKLHLGIVAGTQEPGGPTHPGPGVIPVTIQQTNSLIAGFNGGFQHKDGEYGMIASNITYLPLQNGLATLVIHKDNTVSIINYNGQNVSSALDVRQNGPMLISNGQIVTSSTAWNMQTWGLTTTNTMYTWRSGIGVTKDGDLLFACGPSLVPQTLAATLQAGGAVDAMQLDINPVWVRYVLFQSLGNGKYNSYSLENDMVNGGYAYLTGYQKDFFFLYE